LKKQVPYIHVVEAFLRPHVPLPVRMLDWGGDTGKNSPFQTQAATFHIHDISHVPAVPGAAFVTRAEIDPDHYDLIVCSNVLEHIPHPIDLLAEISACMSAATILYLGIRTGSRPSGTGTSTSISLAKTRWSRFAPTQGL
jgi:hypothetical protein